jgi:hypothetical protein
MPYHILFPFKYLYLFDFIDRILSQIIYYYWRENRLLHIVSKN